MRERLFKKAVKFIHFSFIGTIVFAMQLFFTLMFTEIIHIAYYVSHAIALTLAWLFSFLFNMKITFGVKDRVRKRLGRFAVVAVASSTFNWVFVLFGVERFNLHYFIAIILVTIILSILTFTSEEIWVFSKTRLKRQPS